MANLYFNYSSMNAGKTTVLLQSAHNYRERGLTPLLFTPKLDDRYGEGWVKSRIGLKSKATIFTPQDDLFEITRERLENHNIHCVLVDEAQFLKREQVYQLSEVVDRLNIPVLCFGLRTDFQGELFEGSQYLLAWADRLTEIRTICHTGRKATMVVRIDDEGYAIKEGAQVEIGGNERYVSVSRAEFKSVFVGGQKIKFIEQVGAGNSDDDEEPSESGSLL
jgi:thymidine kinase